MAVKENHASNFEKVNDTAFKGSKITVTELSLVLTMFLIFAKWMVVLWRKPKASVMILIFLFFNLAVRTPLLSLSNV